MLFIFTFMAIDDMLNKLETVGWLHDCKSTVAAKDGEITNNGALKLEMAVRTLLFAFLLVQAGHVRLKRCKTS